MPNWTPLKIRTNYSLQRSSIKIPNLFAKAKEYGYSAMAITELGNLSSVVKFVKEAKEAKIKPLIGCDFYISDGGPVSNLTIICKNLDGWKSLLKAISESNKQERYIVKDKMPTITLERLAELGNGNFIVYGGSINSHLGKGFFADYGIAIKSQKYEFSKGNIRSDWEKYATDRIQQYKKLFGDNNFWLEVQPVHNNAIPSCLILTKIIRHLSKKLNVKRVANADTHYIESHLSEDTRILVALAHQSTLSGIHDRLELGSYYDDMILFRDNSSDLPCLEKISSLSEPEEIDNTNLLAAEVSDFSILSNPKIPQFDCPGGIQPSEYLRQLCLKGWDQLVKTKIPKDRHSAYAERVKYELKLFNEVGLAPYFLVVHDIVSYCQSNGWLASGRGSAGGSIVSWLLGLTEPDPIKYHLIVERFYNVGRNSPGSISLPDIDIDYPVAKRENVISYIRNRFGHDRVAQIATFGAMKGRGALKDVLRAKQVCSAEQQNKITKPIPDESKINDDLEQMRKDEGESSIIKWALENEADKLKEWCYYNDKGQLEGDYAPFFAQAMRLEDVKRTQSKHAAGVVVSSEPLANFCPLILDRSKGEPLVGVDMGDAEGLGGMKLDVLGVQALDDIMDCAESIENGEW